MINIDLRSNLDFELFNGMYDEHMGDNNLKKLLEKIMKIQGLTYHNVINEKLHDNYHNKDLYNVIMTRDDVVYLVTLIDQAFDLEPQFIYDIDKEEAIMDGYIPADELEDYELEDE